MLKHNIKRAELQFNLANEPVHVEGERTIKLEEIIGLLEDDVEDFFFGCKIRQVQSKPYKTNKPNIN